MTTIGFVGLGVMGGPMCRNMALKHDGNVVAFDLSDAAAAILENTKATFLRNLEELAAQADIIFLSLPGSKEVEAVCTGSKGLITLPNKPKIVVDLSTTSVAVARSVANTLSKHGIEFADAPVARTREAAQKGELSIMVGGSESIFSKVEPLLHYIGTDVTHCGDVGCGQVLKLANNALVMENVVAIAEIMVMSERAGVKPEKFIEVISKGSGDSFALRNHAFKAMLPRIFPDKAFSSEYCLKDLSYVEELSNATNVTLKVTSLAQQYFKTAIEMGYGGQYFPVVIEVVSKGGMKNKP